MLGIELMTACFDTMINYRLSQKLLGNGEFNHLTIILNTGHIPKRAFMSWLIHQRLISHKGENG